MNREEGSTPINPVNWEKIKKLRFRLFQEAKALVQEIDPHLSVEQVISGTAGNIVFHYTDDRGQDVPKMSWEEDIGDLDRKSDAEIEAFFRGEFRTRTETLFRAKMRNLSDND